MQKRLGSKEYKKVGIRAGALGLALCTAGALQAQQQPILATLNPAPAHRLLVQMEYGPAAPEAPQGNQANTPPLKDDLFAGTEKFAKGASDATEVNMDPDSLSLVGGPDAKRAHRTLLNVVHTYSYDKPGMYNPADVEEYRHKLETGDWHCSVHTRDLKTGESTDICSRRRAPDMVEEAIITVAPKELTFIHTIRRANGQGSSTDIDAFPGMVIVSGLPIKVQMAMIQPEMAATMAAATAEIQTQMPVLEAQIRQFRFDMPAMNKSLKEFKFKFTPEQQKQMNDLGKQLRAVPVPPVPPIPPVPPAPSVNAPAAPVPPVPPTAPVPPTPPVPPSL